MKPAGKMATWLAALVVACTISPASVGAAAVYKCTAAGGRVEFRDWRCAGNSGAKIEVRPNVVGEIDHTANIGE
jgi:hypothetical protein